ncbi:dihydrofolate reductase family protein [Streptosporangium sp. CA-115845]|uniref:dihydrofolate reductase family protein n=1 Tax=Streptosporangium sp. CA-115845 TaxID=3240071 RepID=UPI003D90172F
MTKRKLVYFVASSVDGFIAGPDGADPTGPGGFWPIADDYAQYIVAEYPETLPGPARQALGVTAPGTRFDTVLEGRHSYEVGLKAGFTDAYPHLRHIVFSRTLSASLDPAVQVVSGDPAAVVRELKNQEGKDIWLVGGGALAGSLYRDRGGQDGDAARRGSGSAVGHRCGQHRERPPRVGAVLAGMVPRARP